jgi:ABC-type multidrug transport system fused ATPase/permease subunit
VILATGTGQDRHSLKHITTCSRIGQSLLHTIARARMYSVDLYSGFFHTAAFWAVVDAAENRSWMRRNGWFWPGEMEEGARVMPIGYEDIRREGGVALDVRGLGFAYKGEEPILRDINFSLEAGTSLAIVGFNGGGEAVARLGPMVSAETAIGKTTLVKVLIGL